MKKLVFLIPALTLLVSCGGNDLCGEYQCEMANGEFGSNLRFKGGGKVFIDLIPADLAERNPELGSKLNVPGTYEVVDSEVVISYFDGYQNHTLSKVDDKLTSTSDLFKLCTCKNK
ncbi:hypothetical protein POV27_12120 [Aureisphaera galaxeae]|uniref:hypothetical protein n=1 Tax=Aureisphaera galaxeae TaxID=1538023 RepID=UPI002350587A|nr:hypothetical protein [Aureisphaera galaxeae]MDC8004801.1 hypothetical protein [Aureisphaera galaxeae]